ncbi:MAG: 7-cyano-7-deazaguanine synthase [Archaeoglobaceae archaeon]
MKVLSLLSGGIDSVVACYLMLDRAEIEYLHVSTGNRSVEKVKELVSRIDGKKDRIYSLEQLLIMEKIREFMIRKRINEKYTCVYCKRGMLKAAEVLAEKVGCDAVLTGDNIGQVASQTIRNLYMEDIAVEIPVIRPLIGLDKDEIIELAKKAGTYDISIMEDEGCVYLPSQPITRARKDKIMDFDFSFKPIIDKIEVLDL